MKYTSYSNERKVQAIISYYRRDSKMSKREFCQQNNLILTTFNYWLKQQKRRSLTIDRRKNNHRPALDVNDLKERIREKLLENGLQTIQMLRKELYQEFPYSLSTYYKVVHSCDFTFKRVSTYIQPKNTNTKKVLDSIQKKIEKLQSIGVDDVVAIDEVPFYEEMLPTYGWSLQGKKVQARKNTMRSKHHSVLSAVSSSGQFEYKIVESGNSEEFCKFLEEIVFVKFKDKTHFLMDNARTQHSKVTKKVFEKHSRNQIFTVPYTPELNPIENCFSVIKSRVRYDCPGVARHLNN